MHRIPTRTGAGPLVPILFRISFIERASEFGADTRAIFESAVKFLTFVRIVSILSPSPLARGCFLFSYATFPASTLFPANTGGPGCSGSLRSRGGFAACMAPHSWAWGKQEAKLIHYA